MASLSNSFYFALLHTTVSTQIKCQSSIKSANYTVEHVNFTILMVFKVGRIESLTQKESGIRIFYIRNQD